MATWSAGFEEYPSGKDFGSVSCLALIDLKTEFGTRFSQEHYLDETAALVCYHLAGSCSVVKVVEGSPTSLGVVGALHLDKDAIVLYRDRGAGLSMDTITSKDHGALTNLDVDDHTQYVLAAGDDLDDVSVPRVGGLSQVIGDYADEDILPLGLHKTGSTHVDAEFDGSNGIKFGWGKCYEVYANGIYENASATDTGNLDLGRGSFVPYVANNYGVAGTWLFHPAFEAAPADNYNGKCRLTRIAGTGLKLRARRISAS